MPNNTQDFISKQMV